MFLFCSSIEKYIFLKVRVKYLTKHLRNYQMLSIEQIVSGNSSRNIVLSVALHNDLVHFR